jgi:transposase/arginine repressor
MYSLDFRKLAIKLSKSKGIKTTCNLLNINRSTIWRWKQNIKIKKRKTYTLRMFEKYKQVISSFIINNPCISQQKMKKKITDFKLSKNTLSKYIKLLNFTRKRTQRRGICKNNALPQLTKSFIDRYKQFEKDNIVCVDECGFSETLRPPYGYSKKGTPLILKTPSGWSHYSLLLAIFSYGRIEYFITKGGICKEMFQTFINNLCLSNNEAILMDNASIHKNLTLNNKVNIIYTPPYSPEYNAIELCFSQIKQVYKKQNIFQNNEIETTIVDSIFNGLSSDKIYNCYNHVDNIIKNFKI